MAIGTSVIRVEGLNRLVKKMNLAASKICFKTLKGLIAGGLFLQRQSQKLTPVDTGNLKASAFTIWQGKNRVAARFNGPDAGEVAAHHDQVIQQEQMKLPISMTLYPSVEVGYTAAYAIYVHEDLQARHSKAKGKMVTGVKLGEVQAFFDKQGNQFFDSDVKQIGEAKFLEKAFMRNQRKILALIAMETITK